MDKEELLTQIADALVNYLDDRDPSVVSAENEEPGPVLRLKLSDGSEWIVNVVEA